MTVTSAAGAVSPGLEPAARQQDLVARLAHCAPAAYHGDLFARRKAVLGSQEAALGRHHAVLAMRAGLAARTGLAAREAGR